MSATVEHVKILISQPSNLPLLLLSSSELINVLTVLASLDLEPKYLRFTT